MKKAFPFYRSYYEQLQHLEDKQRANIVITICKVHFFEQHIDDVVFEDKMLKLAWSGIKHSIKTSIDGYCSKMKIDYGETLTKGLHKVLNDKNNIKNKSNEEVKEEEQSLTSSHLIDEIRVAKYLLKKILENKPNFKQPNIDIWAKDIREAITKDGRTPDQLIGCIDWIYSKQGSFWIPNILSGKKLREKFDVMESQMINNRSTKNKNKTEEILKKGGY